MAGWLPHVTALYLIVSASVANSSADNNSSAAAHSAFSSLPVEEYTAGSWSDDNGFARLRVIHFVEPSTGRQENCRKNGASCTGNGRICCPEESDPLSLQLRVTVAGTPPMEDLVYATPSEYIPGIPAGGGHGKGVECSVSIGKWRGEVPKPQRTRTEITADGTVSTDRDKRTGSHGQYSR